MTKPRPRAVTPVVLQMENVECGAAALGSVLGYHGRFVPLAELRRVCGVSRDGCNASNILRAARGFGMEARGFTMDLEEVRQIATPCIVFWAFNHFVVVEGFVGERVWLNDPAVGHRPVPLEEFSDQFTGVVLTFAPQEDFERGGQLPNLWTGLRARLEGCARPLLFAVAAGFLLVVPGLVIPATTQVYLDHVLIQGRDDWLRPVLAVLVAMVGVMAILRLLQLACLRRMRLALGARLSARFLEHLLRLPVDFYSHRFAGEIGSRSLLNDKIAGVLSGQLTRTVIDVVMMVFYGALMLFYSVPLTGLGVACAALNAWALRRVAARRVEANMRLLQEAGKVTGAAIAGLQNIETLKASGMEGGFFQRWAGLHARAAEARQEVGLNNLGLGLLPGLLSMMTSGGVLVIGGLFVIEGSMTIGMLAAFGMLMAGFLAPIAGLVGLGQTIQDLQGDLARLDDVLAHEEDPTETADIGSSESGGVSQLRGMVELHSVTFGYSPADPPLVEGLDLRIEPGQRVALVGTSGSGKSTVARLVCGLYQPWSGEIRFDGVPRTSMSRRVLWDSLSLVDQDTALFGGTVRENLTLWDDAVPDAVLARACADAEIHDRVRALPGGWSAKLAENGANLSGGERQRLEIARALASDPTILVLDEATSALDAETERRVVDNIALRGCTCLIVAHRLSTIRDCDQIVMLERGVVVERGTHDELMARDGGYADLVRGHDGAEVLA